MLAEIIDHSRNAKITPSVLLGYLLCKACQDEYFIHFHLTSISKAVEKAGLIQPKNFLLISNCEMKSVLSLMPLLFNMIELLVSQIYYLRVN